MQAQDISLENGKKYTIGAVEVVGAKRYNAQTILSSSGLNVGDEITIPSEKFSSIIHKLWGYKLFSDIHIYIKKVEGDKVFLQLVIKETPVLTSVSISGVKKKEQQAIIKDASLKTGTKLTESFVYNTRNYLLNKYQKEGYLKTKVTIDIKPDSTDVNGVKMLVHIDRGNKLKIDAIHFTGNTHFSDFRLRWEMKNTKEKSFFRFWKRSKYIADKYDEDKNTLIDFYKENGYRDARIVSDSLYYTPDGNVVLDINLEEGKKYYFGDIKFLGNSVYNDRVLSHLLGIKKGDVYNGVLLKKRIQDPTRPDAEDISSLYQNNGYLFAQVQSVETGVSQDTINFEIRVLEGKPAYFNNISVVGNEKTNDNVIYREMRTRPGYLYSKEDVVRTVREIGQMGIFDAQQIVPNFKNADPNAGTVDIEYSLSETGASKIELQGGYGGGSFMGSLGLSFENFSVSNLFNPKAYTPVPMGDAQKLSLRLNVSRYYEAYSFSFSEPWWGGERPVQFSVSLQHTVQYGYIPYSYQADRSKRFYISGVTVGLAKRLRIPDDYFTISHALGLQHYNLDNYNTSLFTFGNGYSNSLVYTLTLRRSSSGPNPIFPMGGSDFSITAKFTPPYSLFNNKDYERLLQDREVAVKENDYVKVGEIDQERFRWLEFYKVRASGVWYTNVIDKFVLKTSGEVGYLGAYNGKRGVVPFERFFVGGDGLGYYAMDGRDNVQMRGYPNQSLSDADGATVYNKFSTELRYPITLKPMASIYGLIFAEGANSYTNLKDFNPFELKRSAGVGARIFMPAFGLLGIDFGYGFDPIYKGGQPSGWQTHFTFGQQF